MGLWLRVQSSDQALNHFTRPDFLLASQFQPVSGLVYQYQSITGSVHKCSEVHRRHLVLYGTGPFVFLLPLLHPFSYPLQSMFSWWSRIMIPKVKWSRKYMLKMDLVIYSFSNNPSAAAVPGSWGAPRLTEVLSWSCHRVRIRVRFSQEIPWHRGGTILPFSLRWRAKFPSLISLWHRESLPSVSSFGRAWPDVISHSLLEA